MVDIYCIKMPVIHRPSKFRFLKKKKKLLIQQVINGIRINLQD